MHDIFLTFAELTSMIDMSKGCNVTLEIHIVHEWMKQCIRLMLTWNDMSQLYMFSSIHLDNRNVMNNYTRSYHHDMIQLKADKQSEGEKWKLLPGHAALSRTYRLMFFYLWN